MNQSQSGLGQGFGIGIIGAIIFLVIVSIGCCCLVFGLAVAFVTITDSGTSSLTSESGGLDAFITPSEQAQESGGEAAPASVEPPAQSPAGQEPAPPPQETTEPVQTDTVSLGQDVFVGQSRWRLLEAQDLGNILQNDSQDLAPLETEGHFIRVRFEIENTGSEVILFSDVALLDNQGRRFEPSVDAIQFIAEQEQCLTSELAPGAPQLCAKIYDVPADAAGLKLEAFDLISFEAGKALLDLGF